MTRDEAIEDYERTREWSDSPSARHDRTAGDWTAEMNDILALAFKATAEESKVTLSEKEVKSIWPEV